MSLNGKVGDADFIFQRFQKPQRCGSSYSATIDAQHSQSTCIWHQPDSQVMCGGCAHGASLDLNEPRVGNGC
ncbi:hypothetical protein FOWG_16653 [Fusarium oxysporum f. sp. lycopersici MN25]|nr:hypothetical protein FOWG_16653 [Fusarium oxysporum f. sp. lycopersici MN25]